ncbi:MAG: glutathione S-transferase N-terminal domain-containing protein [Pseudomonadota bacterium]
MIKLYTWNTPNGQKPVIFLEEIEESYELIPVDITAGKQFEKELSEINPNHKIPALVDDVVLFESGAILTYLADKYSRFLAPKGQIRASTLSWVYWQVGGFGPMIGQWGHFVQASPPVPYAVDRFLNETVRLYQVLENRLGQEPYLGGPEYTIADMMVFPWARSGLQYLTRFGASDKLGPLVNFRQWIEKIEDRPAVKSAFERLDH